MTVTNSRYALPSRHHDVVEDINNLRTTLRTIDADITDIEEAIPELEIPSLESIVKS